MTPERIDEIARHPDKARLDWLDLRGSRVRISGTSGYCSVKAFAEPGHVAVYGEGIDLRAAIDAAMRPECPPSAPGLATLPPEAPGGSPAYPAGDDGILGLEYPMDEVQR